MACIFISHSSNDKDFVRQLALDIKGLGHEPWLDEWEIKVGECIVSKVEKGISQADYVVIVLSPSSVQSGWVDREWKAKYWEEVNNNKVLVLPLLLETCDIPSLLKTKKYADFRKSYALGLVELMNGMPFIKSNQSHIETVKPPLISQEVSQLITKIQSKMCPLAQCISEALVLAIQANNSELELFCRAELLGVADNENASFDYRLVNAYISPSHQINLGYIGWESNPDIIFSQIERDTENFYPIKMKIVEPVAVIEEQAKLDYTDRIITKKIKWGDFIPNAKNPEFPAFIYARANSYKYVVESIRKELTTKLLSLLPTTV